MKRDGRRRAGHLASSAPLHQRALFDSAVRRVACGGDVSLIRQGKDVSARGLGTETTPGCEAAPTSCLAADRPHAAARRPAAAFLRRLRPATSDQRPATSGQRPATSDQRPASCTWALLEQCRDTAAGRRFSPAAINASAARRDGPRSSRIVVLARPGASLPPAAAKPSRSFHQPHPYSQRPPSSTSACAREQRPCSLITAPGPDACMAMHISAAGRQPGSVVRARRAPMSYDGHLRFGCVRCAAALGLGRAAVAGDQDATRE